MLDLDAIKARCEAATPGPWEWHSNGLRSGDFDCIWGTVDNTGETYVGVHEDDSVFIAHAIDDIPALVAEVERLRGEVERLSVFEEVEITEEDLKKLRDADARDASTLAAWDQLSDEALMNFESRLDSGINETRMPSANDEP